MGFDLGGALGGALGGFFTGGVGGALVGGLMGGLSGDDKDAMKQMDAAEQAAYLQYKAAEDQLKFSQDQYQDWQNVYGPIQDNLGDYFQTLNPERYASLQKVMRQKEYLNATRDFSANLSQRGISDSGIAAQGYKDLMQSQAENNIAARQYGLDYTNQQKMNFLGLGLGNQGALVGGVNNAYGGLQNASANNASMYSNWANMSNARTNQSYTNAMGAIGAIGGRGGFDSINNWLGTTFGIPNNSANHYPGSMEFSGISKLGSGTFTGFGG